MRLTAARILETRDDASIVLIRLMVGAVFLSEGFQKLIFPTLKGAGFFLQIGLPLPDILGYWIGSVEMICGAMVLAGFLTRPAVLPLIGIIIFAVNLTKIPLAMDEGFWEAVSEARIDYAMLLGTLFLLITGGGRWSWDLKHIGPGVSSSDVSQK